MFSGTHIESQRTRAINVLVPVDTNERIASFIKRAFQADDNKLEFIGSPRSDVVSNLPNVHVVQGSIDLIKHKERSWLVTRRAVNLL